MAEAKINLEINRIGKVKYMVVYIYIYPSGELGSAVVRCWTTALGVAGIYTLCPIPIFIVAEKFDK